MHWLHEPARWSDEQGVLRVTADAGTDFWRTTSYGYVRDNGHLYGEVTSGDFDLSMRVEGAYGAQYDQAGAMVRIDERNWIKTGVEYFENRMRLSTVITFDYSSWVVADLAAPSSSEISLGLSRCRDTLEVRFRLDDSREDLGAVLYLPPGAKVLAGAMCAAPEGPGFEVVFRDLELLVR